MHGTYYAFAAAIGWCGTLWPGWIIWKLLHPHSPDPGPGPDPWLSIMVNSVIGVVGGVAGAYAVSQALPGEVSLVTVSIGAFVGARVAGNVYGLATMKSGAARA